jgi:hypothetical protein
VIAHEDTHTIWDVLMSPGAGIRVTHPDRPSHAIVSVANGWSITVTVSPGARCSSGLARLLSSGEVPDDIMGRQVLHDPGGSPEGWFDLAADAEVAIRQDDGRWYECETEPPDPDVTMPTWGYVDPDQLIELIERVDQQPGGCLCPACHP